MAKSLLLIVSLWRISRPVKLLTLTDVLPRVHDSIANLLAVDPIQGIERSEDTIKQVLKRLDEAIKLRS